MSKIKKFDYDRGAISLEMLMFMHPAIVVMITWTNLWCTSNGVMPYWTSWQRSHEENEKLGATDVHIWRAADLSLAAKWGWNEKLRNTYMKTFRRKFKLYGAFSVGKNDKLFRAPIVRHDSGHGEHFHLQCAPHVDINFVVKD